MQKFISCKKLYIVKIDSPLKKIDTLFSQAT